MSLTVPATLEAAIDPAWLSAALADVSGGKRVTSVAVTDVIKTMCSKVRVSVTFEGDPNPHAYCLKAFLGEEYGRGGATTLREARFYIEIAPTLGMRVPAVPAYVIDHQDNQAIMIMEDMIVAGAQFCDARTPFTLDQVAESLSQLARLHAASPRWVGEEWIPVRIEEIVKKSPYFTVERTQELLNDPRSETLRDREKDAATLFAGMAKLADYAAARPRTLSHGDCHQNNLYMTADGPGFTDWQLLQKGLWAFDVAYHISAVLPVEVAAREERALVRHYLTEVSARGGSVPGEDDIWEDYARAQIYGFFHWAITQRVDPAITRVNIERLGAGVERWESFEVLGV